MIVVAVLAVGALVWKIVYWVAKVDLAARDFGAFTEKTFPAFAKEIRHDVKQILLRLPPPTPIESGSPARLNEYGRKMAAFLRAEEWAAGIAATAVREVVGKRPFEIEESVAGTWSRTWIRRSRSVLPPARTSSEPNATASSPSSGSCCATS